MLKIEKTVRTVSLLNNPALVSAVRQPAIDLPTQDTTPMKNTTPRKNDIPNTDFCSLVASSAVNFLSRAHSYTAKEDYKES